ncbi:MAG: TonB family protein [Gemmatimonadota bacterium]|nr:TonB family protein [Gemmatimonadota bacterium]
MRGSVQDESGRGVVGARVFLTSGSPAGESDVFGRFQLVDAPLGEAKLVIRRIGFAPETLPLVVGREVTELEGIALRRVAMPLQAVIVNGHTNLTGPMAGFYTRRDRGQGRFFTQEQIERLGPRRMSDLLRSVPGLRVDQRRYGVSSFRMRGAPLAPLVWLDGTPMGSSEVDLDSFDPRSFAGIEVYSGAATVPVEFAGNRMMSTAGGAVLLWSRQGQFAQPRGASIAQSPAALIAGMLERAEIFTRDQVETEVAILGDGEVRPIYPDSLYRAHLTGQVEVEFVVDPSGRLRMDTFGVVSTTHHSLVASVRRAIEERRFLPATRGGLPVSQLVQQPFVFVPDPAAARRAPRE